MARILIIDDEKPFRSMLHQMLERAGHEVTEAADGSEGIRLYRQKPTDLIITDIFMPEKEGIETILELKLDFPRVKIIAISGGGRIGGFRYLESAKEFGAERALTKPFTRKELLAAIDEVLSPHSRQH